LEFLKQQFATTDSIDNQLSEIIVSHFRDFCHEKKNGATYNQLKYEKELMSELVSEGTIESEGKIIELLFYFNFNDENFVSYLFDKLKQKIDLLSKKEKIDYLRFEQKNFNQMPTKLIHVLSTNNPGLKQQVNQWLDEEIKFLERISHPEFTEPNAFGPESFVHVSFRGPEIYLLHKAFIDAGGAPAENYKSLLTKTSSRLANKNQKGFSPESLKKASDKVDPEAKEIVKRFLHKMIRNIDSYD
jgi:hypothetical protein